MRHYTLEASNKDLAARLAAAEAAVAATPAPPTWARTPLGTAGTSLFRGGGGGVPPSALGVRVHTPGSAAAHDGTPATEAEAEADPDAPPMSPR